MEPKDTAPADANTPEAPVEKGPLRGTLLEAADIADWGNNSVIVEKRPVTEAGEEVGGKAADAPAADAPVEPVAPVEPELVADEPAIPAVADPGEYQPADYSFEVTTYDAEGKNGRSRKISSVEDWDTFIDGEPNFGNATALLKAQRLATKMETALDRDQAEYNNKKTAFDEYTQTEEARVAATTQISNEINYLVDRGELPKVAPEFVTANWADPKVAAQSGVKEQIALLAYMQKENNARAKAGLAPMTSALDAWNAYQLDQAKQTTATRQQQAGQQRKEAGARVAPSSPAPASSAPRGIAVGRGGSLNDLGTQDWSTGA